MRSAFKFLFFILLFGCSNIDDPKTVLMDEIREEKLVEFSDKFDERVNHSLDLVKEHIISVNEKNPKAQFYLTYSSELKNLIVPIKNELFLHGILPQRIELINYGPSEPGEYKVRIISKFIKIRDLDCGSLEFRNRATYQFGCSVEYNRQISIN